MGESDSKNRNSWAPSEAKLGRGATKIRFSMEPGVGRNKTLRLRNSSGLEGETKISYDNRYILTLTFIASRQHDIYKSGAHREGGLLSITVYKSINTRG